MSVAEPRNLIEVLSRMEYWRQEPAVERNRAFKRFEVRGEAVIEPVQDTHLPDRHTIMLRDISRGGLGFLCTSFLEPGSVWRVAFYDRGHRVSSQVLCVRFCRLVQDGLYLAGTQFIIEPYIMLTLGISESDLTEDIHDNRSPADTTHFVPPDSVDDEP